MNRLSNQPGLWGRGMIPRYLSHLFLSLFLLAATVALVACNGSGDNRAQSDGEVVIGLTDAEGDFASYTVDVLSLTLTKANGAVVETLPLTTRVDFAQYTDLTEFLTAATVPNGAYVKASMVLDYSNADIWVENAAGEAVQVNTIVDGDGNPIDQLEVAVHLDGRNKLVIAPGVPSHLTLDFDLKASNSVSFDTAGVPTQTVEPILLADAELQTPKPHRLRGPLASVDVDNQSFEVILRPFYHLLNHDHQRRFGALHVVTDDSTVFDVGGESYEGQAGLEALDAQSPFTAVIVIGDLKLHPRRFEAREVYAGSSVPGGVLDAVTGNVIARNGNSLTVKGATLVRAGGSVIFNDEVTVNLGDMTTVKRQMSLDNTYGIDDISVGQRVRVFGTLTNDAANALEMDAGVSNLGRVQMRYTTLRGNVVGMAVIQMVPTPPVPFAIDVQAIDGRRIGLFDFSGTGDSSANDADPSRYQIDVGALDVSALTDGTPVKVRGFVRPFGQVTADSPAAFTAQSVVDVSALKAVMAIGWNPASATAMDSLSADGMTLNLDGVGLFHHLARGRVATDLTTLGVAPQIVPPAGGDGLYWLVQGGAVQLHTTFADFAADLDTRLAGGALVRQVFASGSFDDDGGVLTSANTSIVLE